MEMILLIAHILIVVAMVGAILIQKTSTDSLSGLSGASSNPGAMNVRGSANLLTRTTAILAVAFLCTSMLLAINANKAVTSEVIDKLAAPTSTTAPAAPAIPQVPVAE